MKKYSLIESDRSNGKQKLYQIKALKTFTTSNGTKVKEGDLGGFIRINPIDASVPKMHFLSLEMGGLAGLQAIDKLLN